MKAIWYEKYGTPDVLQLKEVPVPSPKTHEVLVKMKSASINASDLEFMKGEPLYVRMWSLLKPKNKILGSDIAGIVQSKGNSVVEFQIGDEVFGDNFEPWGGFAQYVCVPEKSRVENLNSSLLMKPRHYHRPL